jgi:hypothetical protein
MGATVTSDSTLQPAAGAQRIGNGKDSHAEDIPGRLAAGPGRQAVLSVAVEEVFLEGENATVLHHEAGSDQASELLETSGIWKVQGG